MWIRKIAAVNIKKSGGNSTTNTKTIQDSFNKSKQQLLAEQFALYDNLDYIICCGKGVKESLCKALKEDTLKNKWSFSYKGQWLKEQKTEILLPPPDVKAPVIIKYYHPQIHIGREKLFSTLMDVVGIINKQK